MNPRLVRTVCARVLKACGASRAMHDRLRDHVLDLQDEEAGSDPAPRPAFDVAARTLLAMVDDGRGGVEGEVPAVTAVDALLRAALRPYPEAGAAAAYRNLKVILARVPLDAAAVVAWYRDFCGGR